MILSNEHDQVLPAFVAAVTEIGAVTKAHEADAGTYSYRYASLGDTLDEVRRVCAAHDLIVTQNLGHEVDEFGDRLTVTLTVLHSSGQWITWPPVCNKVAADPQKGVGATSTYLRRYQLVSTFAIPVSDDDGRMAARGLIDEAAEEAARRSAANHVFNLIKAGTDEQKAAVKQFAADRGEKVSIPALLDDGWRADVGELLETIGAGS